jgi:AcrR family transcriptional regulator
MGLAGSAPGRRTRMPSTDIERELVAAAEAVLVRDGPGGMTVRAVAAQAGTAPMGVYNRLGGKDGLVEALLVQGFDRLRMVIASQDEPDPLERLRASGRRYREFAVANPRLYTMMFGAAISPDDGSQKVAAHAAAAFDELVKIVDLASAAGAIVAPNPRQVAQQIWGTSHGAVALELQGMMFAADPAATYGATVEMILRGLAA